MPLTPLSLRTLEASVLSVSALRPRSVLTVIVWHEELGGSKTSSLFVLLFVPC